MPQPNTTVKKDGQGTQQLLDNIQSLISQIGQLNQGEANGGADNASESVKAAQAAYDNMSPEEKEAFKKKMNAEAEAGAKPDATKGADDNKDDNKDDAAKKAAAAKAAQSTNTGDGEGNGSNGSDNADARLEDGPARNDQALSELGKSLALLASTIKSLHDRQGTTEKAMTEILAGLGIDKAILEKSAADDAALKARQTPAGEQNVAKALVDALTKLANGETVGGDGASPTGMTTRKDLGAAVFKLLGGQVTQGA